MMTEPRSEQDDFHALMEQLYSDVALKDPLKRMRAKAWERYQELGLPSRRHEQFRYIKLRHLFSQQFTRAHTATIPALDGHLLPECSHVVLVNGEFRPELSQLPEKVVVADLVEASRTYSGFLTNQWNQSLKDEQDAFAALNAALHEGGLFLYVPPKTVLETPIQIVNVVTVQNGKNMILPRLNAYFGSRSEVSLVWSNVCLNGSGYLVNQVCEFTLEEEANVKLVQTSCELSPDVWFLDALRVTLKKNSIFHAVNYTEGSFTVRNDYRVALTGEHGEASLNGVWMLDEKLEAHTHVLIDHQAPSCLSNQLFKGVLTDLSRSSFEGKIFVQREAQKTMAYQLNRNLLLSDRANADSKPNLEIFADDVKASHGATIGQLDEEQMFYLRTRGYNKEEARNILVYAYTKEVLDLIKVPTLHQQLLQRAERFLA